MTEATPTRDLSQVTPLPLYKETNFKESSIGKIPRDWNVKTTREIGEVITGITPSTVVEEYWNGNYPFVTPTDITGKKYVEKTERKVSTKGLEKGRIIPKDSVLVTCIASIGKIALAFEGCLTNQQINAIICKNEVNPHYVYYAIGFRASILESWAGKTTSPIIKKSLFEKFPIPMPTNPSEQRAIVGVLGVVDCAIELADRIIAQTERLKRGLMQQLLTRGIGHTETKQNKELGRRIPAEWQVVRVGQVCRAIVPGRNKPKRFDGDIPWITLPDIQGILISESKKGLSISKEEAKEIGNKIVPAQSVVMNCIGEFGTVGITTRDVVLNQQLHAFVCPENIDPYFLALSLISQVKYMQSIATKTVVPYMNKGKCNSVPIALPSLSEQKKIASIISAVNEKIELERKEKAILGKIKAGLMDLLLTGKVRIKVD
jgi:type I restriction enzyme S subunit